MIKVLGVCRDYLEDMRVITGIKWVLRRTIRGSLGHLCGNIVRPMTHLQFGWMDAVEHRLISCRLNLRHQHRNQTTPPSRNMAWFQCEIYVAAAYFIAGEGC